MKTKFGFVFLLLIVPTVVASQVLPDSTASTVFELSIGHGSFAKSTYDSTGEVIQSDSFGFSDAVISVTQIFHRLIRCKMAFGIVSRMRDSDYLHPNSSRRLSYVTPTIGIDTRYFAFDFGYLFNFNRSIVLLKNRNLPSIALRIGNRDVPHFSGSFANNVPLFSGGGLLDIGMGFPLGYNGSGWIGMGGYPSESNGLIIKTSGFVGEILILDIRLRFGLSDNEIEYSIAAGVKAIF